MGKKDDYAFPVETRTVKSKDELVEMSRISNGNDKELMDFIVYSSMFFGKKLDVLKVKEDSDYFPYEYEIKKGANRGVYCFMEEWFESLPMSVDLKALLCVQALNNKDFDKGRKTLEKFGWLYKDRFELSAVDFVNTLVNDAIKLERNCR